MKLTSTLGPAGSGHKTIAMAKPATSRQAAAAIVWHRFHVRRAADGRIGVTLAALREKQYAAVMAATGLLYLAILTGFGVDLVARATLG